MNITCTYVYLNGSTNPIKFDLCHDTLKYEIVETDYGWKYPIYYIEHEDKTPTFYT